MDPFDPSDDEERLSEGQGSNDGPTVLKISGLNFVVGLRWHTLVSSLNFMSEAREYGKNNDMDIVVIREGLVTQGGFVSKKSGVTKMMYSAASVLSEQLGSSWLAVFQLDEDRYYLVAADSEAIIPSSDIIGDESLIRARMLDLNSMFNWAESNIIAPAAWAFGGTEKSLDSFLNPQSVSKRHRLKQLTLGLSGKEWLKYGTLVLVIGAAGVGVWAYYQIQAREEADRLRKARAAQQAELNRLDAEQRRQIESSSLTHPWTLKPRLSEMLPVCESAIYSLPLSIGGWAFTGATCTPGELSATYTRKAGASNVSYLAAFAEVFSGGNVNTAIREDKTATFSIGMKMTAGVDEIKLLKRGARNTFLSYFQRIDREVKVDSKASEVIAPSLLPNGKPWPKGANPPAPTWNTYSFTFNTATSPSNALTEVSEDGIRVTAVTVSFKEDSASFDWTTDGELYGLQ